MTDSRQRFEAWIMSLPGLDSPYFVAKRFNRYLADGVEIRWQAWEARDADIAQAVRRCAELCDEYAKASSNPMNFAENAAEAIKREFPEAFK